jgi:hypothetical protein
MSTSDIPPLNVKINIDASGVQAGVAKATAGLEQISANSKKVSATMMNLKTTMLGVFGGTLLTSGIFALGHELNAMKQETIDLQAAGERLNVSLSAIGVTSKDTQQEIFNAADSFYQLGFQGSEAVTAMGTLVTATGSVSQATKLMAMAADYARYKHVDMNTAATALARGTTGNMKAFTALGITLDKTLPKNKAIAKAFNEMNAIIGGQALAYSKTFAGQMAILKEKFDNVAQTIGKAVLPVFTALVKVISGIADYITKNSTALGVFLGILIPTIIAVKTYGAVTFAIKSIQQAYAFWTYAQATSTNVFKFALFQLNAVIRANPIGALITALTLLAVAFSYAWKHSETFRNVMVTGIQVIMNSMGYLIGGVATLLKYMSKIPGMGFLADVSKEADKAANSVRKLSDGMDKLRKPVATPKVPKVPGVVKPGEDTGILGNASDTGGAQTVQYITVYASNTNDIEKKLAMAAKVGVPVGSK